MKTKSKISSLFILAGVLASFAPIHASNSPDILTECREAEPPRSIPLKIYRSFWVVVEGQFGGVPGPQNFILDTGTSPSIIQAGLARRLGLATEPSMITAAGKAISTSIATVPEIDLGPIRAVSLPVQVQDLSRLERDLGMRIAGIIGLDVLSKSNFRLDYRERAIRFGCISLDGIPVHFDPHAGIAVAEVKLRGKALRMLLDTGTDQVVLFGRNFADVDWLALRNTSQSGASLAEEGEQVQVFSAPDILLGGQHFSEDRAYFVPEGAHPAFDGLLGVRALGFRALSYDRESATIYLQK